MSYQENPLSLDALESTLQALQASAISLPGYRPLADSDRHAIHLVVVGCEQPPDLLELSLVCETRGEGPERGAALHLVTVARATVAPQTGAPRRGTKATITLDLAVVSAIVQGVTTLQRAFLEGKVHIEGPPEASLPAYGLFATLHDFLHLTIKK